MTVTKSPLNKCEEGIIQTIEESMPDGIHVRGIIKKNISSPTTVVKYLRVLEKEHKIIYSEKIKNRDVYRIKHPDIPTFIEAKKTFVSSILDSRSAIIRAITKSSSFGVAERIEAYHHAIMLLALLKYQCQFYIDIGTYRENDKAVKDYMCWIDNTSQNVNTIMDPVTRKFFEAHLDHTISETFELLSKLKNARKGKPSKFIKALLNETQKSNPAVFDTITKIDQVLKDSTRSKNQDVKH